MTPSDRGPVIQQRLQHLRDSVLSNLWVVHRHYCGQLCQCPQLSDWQASIIADAAAEIQRLTGELAQARRELREQDVEADRLTRELIQAQGALSQARAVEALIATLDAEGVSCCCHLSHEDIPADAHASFMPGTPPTASCCNERRQKMKAELTKLAALAAPGDETPGQPSSTTSPASD